MVLSATRMRYQLSACVFDYTYIADHQPCTIAHQAVLSPTNTTSACVVDKHSIDARHVRYCPTDYVTDLSHQTCGLDP